MFWEYANGFMLEAIALKAIMIMPSFFLQHPRCQSKLKQNLCCLERLSLWKNSSISEQLLEGQSIQGRLKPSKTVCALENPQPITFAIYSLWVIFLVEVLIVLQIFVRMHDCS